MRKRTRYSLLTVLVLLSALAVALILRQKAPPEAARLLPESDALVYINVKAIRSLTHLDQAPVARDAEYQTFIDATGLVPERDLDSAAFALHRMPDPNGPNGPVAYSEVFEGRFDGTRLTTWLAGHAAATEAYASRTIYTIPVEGRRLRVALMGYDMIAASNTPTSEQIHSILDRYRANASPFSGSSLLEARYRDVPLLSTVWGIGRIGLPFAQDGRVTVMGLQLPLPSDTTFVASLRPSAGLSPGIHLRVDELEPTEGDAADSAKALSSLLDLYRSLEQQAQVITPTDHALHELTQTMKIEQKKERVTLTATVPAENLKALAGTK